MVRNRLWFPLLVVVVSFIIAFSALARDPFAPQLKTQSAKDYTAANHNASLRDFDIQHTAVLGIAIRENNTVVMLHDNITGASLPARRGSLIGTKGHRITEIHDNQVVISAEKPARQGKNTFVLSIGKKGDNP
ncbi:MAG: hypothetical protein K9K75_02880 [Deltaproteobacteria bacterium]|nr:hypothetical protein [Deltaproteobacteria bacterium]